MGKKGEKKDRGYITASEWKTDGGGYKKNSADHAFRRLPYFCCAVTFTPFDDPVRARAREEDRHVRGGVFSCEGVTQRVWQTHHRAARVSLFRTSAGSGRGTKGWRESNGTLR